MKVEYLDHMGNDLTIVNAARVSFNKKSNYEVEVLDTAEEAESFADLHKGSVDRDYILSDRWMGGYPVEYLSEKDKKLINYLAEHKHLLPFRHPQIQLHIKAPIFVFRQLDKHQVGFSKSEISRRYISSTPEMFTPDVWRKAAKNVKQGSSDEEVRHLDLLGFSRPTIHERVNKYYEYALDLYEEMITYDVAPEMARMVLPQAMYTEQYITGSLLGWFTLVQQRTDSHAQKEIQEVAHMIEDVVKDLFPVSWEALKNNA